MVSKLGLIVGYTEWYLELNSFVFSILFIKNYPFFSANWIHDKTATCSLEACEICSSAAVRFLVNYALEVLYG